MKYFLGLLFIVLLVCSKSNAKPRDNTEPQSNADLKKAFNECRSFEGLYKVYFPSTDDSKAFDLSIISYNIDYSSCGVGGIKQKSDCSERFVFAAVDDEYAASFSSDCTDNPGSGYYECEKTKSNSYDCKNSNGELMFTVSSAFSLKIGLVLVAALAVVLTLF